TGDPPDELMIQWGNVPRGSDAAVYIPGTSAAKVLEMAGELYPTHRLEQADAHTLRCPAEGITYIPIPAGTDVNYPGLLTIDLPSTVRKGEVFKVVVQQITNAAGRRPAPPPPPPRIGSGREVKPLAKRDEVIKW